MAIQPNVWSLAEEALSEYLTTVRICLDHRKDDRGCLGYPAALLSLCVVNAIGTYLRNEKVSIDGKNHSIKGEPFLVLNHTLVGQNLTRSQIKAIEGNYRNLLAHHAMLAPGAFLVPGPKTSPFVFTGDKIEIHVEAFYKIVSTAWSKFDKSRIKTAVEGGFVKATPRRSRVHDKSH